MVYYVVRALIRLLLPLQMRLRVAGADRVPARGPLILVANHLGLLDPLAIATRAGRRVRILAKAEVFDWPILGGMARACGFIGVRRGASDRAALRALGEALARGDCVLLMPEGTYPKVPLPAAMLPLKTGAAFLAVHSGAPVLPVAVAGAHRVWSPPRGWRPWHRPRVTIAFGEPYRPPTPARATKRAYEAIADDMGRRIAALLPPEHRGHYAGSPVAAAHEQGLRLDDGLE